jgi:hypothetical protein
MSESGKPSTSPLPGLLLLLSVTTGLVDAVSVLGLGKVFTANMTGNIVFLGFAAAGTPASALRPIWSRCSPSSAVRCWRAGSASGSAASRCAAG